MRREEAGAMLLQCLDVEIEVEADGARAHRSGPWSEADWDAVVREAMRQGIAPLLYRRLQGGGLSASVPPRVMERLREMALGYALKSLRLYRELAEVLTALRGEGIGVIVLKGAHLAECVYGDKALRAMRDLDLLVRKADLARAEAKLLEMGYEPRPRPDFLACHHLHPLARPGGIPVELHWTLESPTEPIAIDLDGLWQRARPATIAGVDVLVLAPEDLLLHLCLHTSFHHQFELGLRGCWDILETLRHHRETVDWAQLQRRARQWGIEKYVYLTLRLARELLGAAVPASALAVLEPRGFEPQLVALAIAEIFHAESPSVSSRFVRMWGSMRFRERVACSMEILFPSIGSLSRQYPASASARWRYPYYLLRWRDLVGQYSRTVFRMIRRDRDVVAMVRRERDRASLMNWLKAVAS